MKEDLTKELLEKGLQYLKSAEAFTKDNIPKYIEEILAFQVYDESVDLLWSLFPIMLSTIAIYYAVIKKYSKDGKKIRGVEMNGEEGEEMTGLLLFGCAALFFGSLMAVTSLLDIVKIYVAPRMYLIEYFQDILR